MHRQMRRTKPIVGISIMAALVFALACGRETVIETVIERTVEVPVERTVIVEVPVETIKTVEVLVTPVPETASPTGPSVYKMGIFQEPNTRNYWNYYGGPGGSVWTGYVLDGVETTLYGYSDQRFDWIPILADGFPTELTRETVNGKDYLTSEISLKRGAKWSDGVDITADDFVFVVNTVMDLELGGNFASKVNPDFLSHVEALDSRTLKVFFKTKDEEGNPISPGISVWQFGLAFTPILPKHYWEPVVEAAKAAGDIEAQQQALFAHIPESEPTAGGFMAKRWEPGAFIENVKDVNWFRSGINVVQYENGAYREMIPQNGYDVTYYGEPKGAVSLKFEIGPHADSVLFIIYENQDAAILALAKGDIDYLFNPNGLEKGFQDRVRATPDLSVISNPSSSLRYLGFNVRKAPMDNKAFRQAVAMVIDKEFVTETILQGSALPVYAMVPAGNVFWHNADVPRIGEGLSREERITQAVQLLKDAGFTYDTEPKVSEDGNFVEVQGSGLRLPDGTLVPEMEIMSPSAGYDPLRSTFAIWIERWLNDIGIPARAKLTGFNVMIDVLFSENVAEELDMWILGWSLSLFPDYLEGFFATSQAEGGRNWGGYSNIEYDKLAADLLKESDLSEARKQVLKLQEFLADDMPYVNLFTTPILDTYRPDRVQFPYTSVLGGIQSLNGLQQEAFIE